MGSRDSPSLTTDLEQHYDDVLRSLTRRMGDVQDAADVAQDTYLRLAAAPEATPEIRDPRAYVFRVAGNLAIDRLRSAKRAAATLSGAEDGDSVADWAPSPEAALQARERLRVLDRALDQLSSNARRALLLNRVDGLTHARIAGLLGVSESMVAKYIAQALRLCRDRLKQAEANN
jgi:RNA polymerase sigma factor (sigma-70 family)